jgi:hypothetical protein
MAHHINIAGEAICPELDEKRKCFAEYLKRAATAAAAHHGGLPQISDAKWINSKNDVHRALRAWICQFAIVPCHEYPKR